MTDRLRLSALAPALLLALALVFVGVLGGMSTNVGHHWDEVNITRSVSRSLTTGLLLPRWYNYPSVPYDVALLTALGDVRAGAISRDSTVLVSQLAGTAFTLQLRTIFFLMCALSGAAVFLVARRLSGSGWAALFAALTLLGSWEFFYQSKWIAPDGLLMFFASVSLWAQQRIMTPEEAQRRPAWLALAAVFAGLCLGTKYPGGLVLLPVLIAVLLPPGESARGPLATVRRAGACIGIAAVTFLLVSPGCVLEPWTCLLNITHEMQHYGTGHGGYTVKAGWEHFSKLAAYLGVVFLSGNVVPAAAAMALALFGAVSLVRSQARVALWLLAFPVIYVAYMCTQRVMIARNYLVLLPYVAVLAGIGVAALARAAGTRGALRHVVAAAAVAMVVFNLGFVTRAALSVASPGSATPRAALEAHLASSPRTRYLLSPACRALLASAPAVRPANVVDALGSADRVVFLSDEIKDWEWQAANWPGRYRTVWCRVQDVNWDYYPTWEGNPRMLDVSASDRGAFSHD